VAKADFIFRAKVSDPAKKRMCAEHEAGKNIVHVRDCTYYQMILEIKDELKGKTEKKQLSVNLDDQFVKMDWDKGETIIIIQLPGPSYFALADTEKNWQAAVDALKSVKEK
jgi:hypothetical protein